MMGRPPEYDLNEEAAALEEWAKKDDSIYMLEFAILREYPAQYLSEWAKKDANFCISFKKAKQQIAARQMKKVQTGEFNYGVFQRMAGFHDSLLHEYEDSLKVREYELKQKVAEATPTTVVVQDYSKSK